MRASNATSEELTAIRQMGPALEELVAGGRGEIAMLSYGDRIRTVQPFTSDSSEVSSAIAGLKASGTSLGVNEAIVEAISQLETRPLYRRRIVLLIGENRDPHSDGSAQEIIERAQKSNVLIYAIASGR